MCPASFDSARLRAWFLVCAVATAITCSGLVIAQGESASPQPPSPTSPPAVSAPPPVKKPPFPNRANELLPAWLRVRGEFRERIERVDNIGFAAGGDDTYFLSRVRLSATATGKRVAAMVQVHDARVGGRTIGTAAAPFTAAFDVRQAFIDVGGAGALLGARVGRQELAFGDQRLLGHAGWLNAARTFDGARLTLRAKAAQIDLFAASLVRILDDQFDKSGNGNP